MSNIKVISALTALSLLAAPNAFAGDKAAKDSQALKAESQSYAQENQLSSVTYIEMDKKSEVLGAIATGDMIRVTDENGNVYINQTIPVEALPDPTLNVTTLDTETYQYKGRVYTNKTVQVN